MELIILIIVAIAIYIFVTNRMEDSKNNSHTGVQKSTELQTKEKVKNQGNPKTPEIKLTVPNNPTSNKSRSRKVADKKTSATKRTYSGPLFAQSGELGKLFGYADVSGRHKLEGPFSIIDLETSGFNPPQSKILEIAILKIDINGDEIDRFETLVDPEDGYVGRTDIHGISSNMVQGAPNFDEISGRVLELIENSVVVAHHAKFEENFLFYQLTESGLDVEVMPALDTLWLARNTVNLPNYKLETVVSGFNEKLIDSHTAIGDVSSVAKILPKMLDKIGDLFYPVNYPDLPRISKPFKAKKR